MNGFRYFKVCPRGFANEVTYYKVPSDKSDECLTEYAHFSDGPGYAEWTTDQDASAEGVAINWSDRNY